MNKPIFSLQYFEFKNKRYFKKAKPVKSNLYLQFSSLGCINIYFRKYNISLTFHQIKSL